MFGTLGKLVEDTQSKDKKVRPLPPLPVSAKAVAPPLPPRSKIISSVPPQLPPRPSIASIVRKNDSEIAVSVSPEDMRKNLLKDITSNEKYVYLNHILRQITDKKAGLFLASSPVIRSMLENALNNIHPSLSKKDEIVSKLQLMDDANEVDTIEANTLEFLNLIKAEERSQQDSVIKEFLHYIQKVTSLEYKNKKHIPKKRYYNSPSTIDQTRGKILSDIKDKHDYDCMNSILKIIPDSNLGLSLSSNESSRLTMLNALSNVLPSNTKQIESYLESIKHGGPDLNRAYNQFLEFIENEEKIQKDMIRKDFLRYIKKVVKLEYMGKNYPLKYKKDKRPPDEREVKTLFPTGSPKIEDIKQGQLGDCYLLAALMSIIKKDPKYITDCFPEKDSYSPYQETVKIKLNRIRVSLKGDSSNNLIFRVSPTTSIIIEVDNTILMKRYKTKSGGTHLQPFGNRTTALWVNFMEKAFNVYKNIEGAVIPEDANAKEFIKKWMMSDDHSLSGQNANGGWEFMPLTIITGKRSSSKPLNIILKYNTKDTYGFTYTKEENKIFNYIFNNLRKGKALTAGTYSDIERNFTKVEKTMGLYPSHAYSIQDTQISGTEKYICLKNPHRKDALRDPAVPPHIPSQMNIGDVKIELKDFIKYFKDINKLNFDKLSY